MKRLIFIVLLIMAGIFMSGNSNFEIGRISLFVENVDRAIGRGAGNDVCGIIETGAKFSLHDTTTQTITDISGGKDEMCKYFQERSWFYTHSPVADWSSYVDMDISRDYLRWRTAHVSYMEPHELEVFPERNRIKFVTQKN